jgi:hypothetical protein
MCTIAKHENCLVDKIIVFGKVLDVVVNVSELSTNNQWKSNQGGASNIKKM